MNLHTSTIDLKSGVALRHLVAGFLAACLVVTVGPVATSAASKTDCVVKRSGTSKTYTRLQVAVRRSKPRSHLLVTGTCKGSTTIGKNVTIRGRRSNRGKAILDGKGKTRVLKVKPGVKVTVQNLTIRNGRSKAKPGGAVINRGKLQLFAVFVRGSRTNVNGGGIYNEGNLQINATSQVIRNKAGLGGGIYNKGVARLDGTSRVDANTAKDGGGVYNTGALRLRELSRISRNKVGRDGSGGGVYNVGDVSLRGNSTVRDNTATRGGAIASVGGSVVLADDSRVRGNSADSVGGVSIDATSSLTMSERSQIRENSGLDVGGLHSLGSIVGVKCAPGTLANVIDNVPADCLLQ